MSKALHSQVHMKIDTKGRLNTSSILSWPAAGGQTQRRDLEEGGAQPYLTAQRHSVAEGLLCEV